MVSSFNSSDIACVVLFFLATVITPLLVGYIKRGDGLLSRTVAGRKLGFWSMALTMFLSENGSAQLTGLAGWAVHSGLGIYAYELIGSMGLITLGWVFMPVYRASGVYTTVNYANKRFGGKRIGAVMVILMLVINLLSKFSLELQVAQMMMRELYDISPIAVNAILLFGSFIVTIPGGLSSMVFTNNIQFVFFLFGIPILFIYSNAQFNSWQEIQMLYQKSWPNTTIEHVTRRDHSRYTHCGIPDIHSLDLIRSHNDRELPWPGMFFGIYINSVYTFCIDQSILQYCLGARDIIHTKYACVVTSFFKVLSIFLVIPGFIARIMFTDIVACSDPDVCERACGEKGGCADLAMPMLFRKLVPLGWRGPTIVAFVAASLTSLAATLHAGSTIFVLDLYRPLRKQITERECTLVGITVELVQACIGIGLVWVLDHIPEMHDFMQQIYSTMVPPLVSVYLLGIFWDRVTEEIAFRALMLGSSISFIRMVWKLSYGFVPCGEESTINLPEIINNFHDLHFGMFLFTVVSCFITISAVMTDPIEDKYLHRLLYWLRYDHEKRVSIEDLTKPGNEKTGGILITQTYQRPSFIQKEIGENSKKAESTDLDTEMQKLTDRISSQDPPDVVEEEAIHGSVVKKTKKDGVKFYALSVKPLKIETHANELKAVEAVKESPNETYSLNAILVVLLLVIAFDMGYFK